MSATFSSSSAVSFNADAKFVARMARIVACCGLLAIIVTTLVYESSYLPVLTQNSVSLRATVERENTSLKGSIASNENIITPPKPVIPIAKITIIGERNSGTKWLTSHLTECFNHTLKVREKLVRHKHWFQHDYPNGIEPEETAVVAIFRDPYYWVEAMRKVPHHAPMHKELRWQDFCTKSWTMARLPSDEKLIYNHTDATKVMCQEKFHYNQINPCLEYPYPESREGNMPRYEMRIDGSGRPYGSILDLRSDKIKNHLAVREWNWVQAFHHVRYEDLIKNGTAHLIQHMEEITGVKSNCNPSPPQNRETRNLDESYILWMTQFVDWEAEALIGYIPWSSTATAPY